MEILDDHELFYKNSEEKGVTFLIPTEHYATISKLLVMMNPKSSKNTIEEHCEMSKTELKNILNLKSRK